jgi:hypothetical protein
VPFSPTHSRAEFSPVDSSSDEAKMLVKWFQDTVRASGLKRTGRRRINSSGADRDKSRAVVSEPHHRGLLQRATFS